MAYDHLPSLYKERHILAFRRAFALEKIHGCTSEIVWNPNRVRFRTNGAGGGGSHADFVRLFDEAALAERFAALGHETEIRVVGEHYGGAIQAMMPTYGPVERFVAFDVRIGPHKLAVPQAEEVAVGLGLEFVPYREIDTDLPTIDAERDRPSEMAVRRGCGANKKREGIVLRPPFEVRLNNGDYVCAKHRRDEYSERATPPKLIDDATLAVLDSADAIADEWVTEMRMAHVLSKLNPAATTVRDTGRVVAAMIEDVVREAEGEIVDSKAARSAIGRRAMTLFHARLKQ